MLQTLAQVCEGFIDGDVIESFLDLDRAAMSEVHLHLHLHPCT